MSNERHRVTESRSSRWTASGFYNLGHHRLGGDWTFHGWDQYIQRKRNCSGTVQTVEGPFGILIYDTDQRVVNTLVQVWPPHPHSRPPHTHTPPSLYCHAYCDRRQPYCHTFEMWPCNHPPLPPRMLNYCNSSSAQLISRTQKIKASFNRRTNRLSHAMFWFLSCIQRHCVTQA